MEIKIKKLTPENFKKFGQVIQEPTQAEPTGSGDAFTYWKQQAVFGIDGKTEVGFLKVKQAEMAFTEMEQHVGTPEMLVALDGDYIIAVAPPGSPTPAAGEVEAFHVSKNQAVVMADGCWHFIPFPVDTPEVNMLVIFKDNCSQEDLILKDLDENCSLTN